jgi:hypothetical protein
MTIHHVNSNCSYVLYESKGNFFIENNSYKAIHAKNDIHAAIWYLIDWIRMVCFTNLSEDDCAKLSSLMKSPEDLNKEEVMNTICGRKLNRVFYEHAYALIFQAYDTEGQPDVILHNDINFFLYEEIIQLLKFNSVMYRK